MILRYFFIIIAVAIVHSSRVVAHESNASPCLEMQKMEDLLREGCFNTTEVRSPEHAKSKKTPTHEITQFIQKFYDKMILQEDWRQVLKGEEYSFSPTLRCALRIHQVIQDQNSGMIEGLDFHPFLNSQDPFEQYVIGEVEKKGDIYSVHIHGVFEKKREQEPSVIAQLKITMRGYMFVNFLYPNNKDPKTNNLLNLLKVLHPQIPKICRPTRHDKKT